MIVVIGPEVDLAGIDAVVGIGIGHAGLHRPQPRLAHGHDPLDKRRACGGLVVTRTHIVGHGLNRPAVPGTLGFIGLVGSGPGGHHTHVHRRVSRRDKLGHLAGRGHQDGGVTRVLLVQGAVAVHHHRVPGPLADRVELVLEMPIDAHAPVGLQVHVIVQPGLHGEGLEQRRHATDALTVEVRHGVGAVVAHGGTRSIRKAVANEENAAGLGRCRGGAQRRGRPNCPGQQPPRRAKARSLG